MSAPSLDYFCDYQRNWILEPAAQAFGEKSRRIGFTHAVAFREVQARTQGHGDYWHSSADLSASLEFVEDCADWAKVFNVAAKVVEAAEVVADEKIQTLQLRFTNGTKIVAGSSNPRFFRSKGGHVGLDEIAFHERARELVKAAHASAIFWGYTLRAWSSHNGQGSFFNHMLADARAGRIKAAVHRVTITDAVEQGIVERIRRRTGKLKSLPAPDAKARQDWLDEMRATCPDQATWDEEYLCIPGSDESALLSYDLIRGCERDAEQLPVVDDPRALKTNAPLYVGLDVGRKHDLTDFWGLAKVGDVFETRLHKTFKGAAYDVQEQYLDLLMGTANVRRLCGDATGIGNMLLERAVQRWGKHRVEPVMFTPGTKSELAMPLVRLFEDKLVRVPADAAVREGLHKVRKIVTAAGNVRFDARHDEDGHADEFWALALAYHAADDLKLPMPRPLAFKPVGW